MLDRIEFRLLLFHLFCKLLFLKFKLSLLLLQLFFGFLKFLLLLKDLLLLSKFHLLHLERILLSLEFLLLLHLDWSLRIWDWLSFLRRRCISSLKTLNFSLVCLVRWSWPFLLLSNVWKVISNFALEFHDRVICWNNRLISFCKHFSFLLSLSPKVDYNNPYYSENYYNYKYQYNNSNNNHYYSVAISLSLFNLTLMTWRFHGCTRYLRFILNWSYKCVICHW